MSRAAGWLSRAAAAGLGVVTVLALPGCRDVPTTPDPPNAAVEEAAASLGPPLRAGGIVLDERAPGPDRLHALYRRAERTELGGGLVHYRFEVPLGPGEFDVVRIHRVVRERTGGGARAPARPVRTDGAVFMTHGASLSFEAIFLDAGTTDPGPRTSLAVYLAANGIDVWGMDFAWGLVPLETADFTFMRDWGVGRDVDHTLAAMSVARWIRTTTGQGPGPMHLLGYSYGVTVAYGAAARETQQRRVLRDVRGIVPVEAALRYPSAEAAAPFAPCEGADTQRPLLDAGNFVDAAGVAFGGLSHLATTDPDGPSPAVPGLTNFQAILFLGANTFLTGPREFWHFVAGDLGPGGIPVGLLHTDEARWIRLGGSLPPYMPRRVIYEVETAACPGTGPDEPGFDDHLSQIRVPILYLGAQGGWGTDGNYTTTQTASDDVTLHTVSLRPPEERTLDYGHADLMIAADAPDLAWNVLRDWLLERGDRRGGG